MNNKILSYIGLATKAGKSCGGEFAVGNAIKANKARLVIIASDASDNTKKEFSDSCKYYNVPIIFEGTKESLGKASGKQIRASIAILDEGFAGAIIKEQDTDNTMKGGE